MISHTDKKPQTKRIVGKALWLFFWSLGLLCLIGGVIGLLLL